MPEDAGKLEVEYVVISDAAVRRLERLQKQMDKVEDAATKQGNAIEATYKKAGKAMAVFGAVATGVLYGIIRASSYSSMWMDQISHQMTRIADKILEITGMDEVIETFIKLLDNLADELTDPEENDFWKRLGDDFDALSTKAKALTIVIGILSLVFGAIAVAKIWGILSAAWIILKGLAVRVGVVAVATKAWAAILLILKGALAFIASTAGLVVIAIAALILILGYLWSKTDHGIAQIKALGNTWDNFKDNISELGWVGAITTALRDLGAIMIYEVVYMLKSVYNTYVSSLTAVVSFVYNIGSRIIGALINGMDNIFPGFRASVNSIYNKFLETFNNIMTMAYNKGKDIIEYLVSGLYAKMPGVEKTVNYLKNIFGMKGDEIVVKANEVGAAVPQAMINNAEAYGPIAGVSYDKLGNIVYSSFVGPIQQIPDSVCDEMVEAVECVEVGVDAINEVLDDITRNIAINVAIGTTTSLGAAAAMKAGVYVDSSWGTSIKASSMPGGGDYGKSASSYSKSSYGDSGSGSPGAGGYGDSSSYSDSYGKAGRPDYGATGGHVLRTGIAMIHQGEDIINLKGLLAGIKTDGGKLGGGDIIINPVINITSGGVSSDPFETNRVADVISKRMGEELRRITTNI